MFKTGLAKKNEKARLTTLLEGYKRKDSVERPKQIEKEEIESNILDEILKKAGLSFKQLGFFFVLVLLVLALAGLRAALLFIVVVSLVLTFKKRRKERQKALNFERDFPSFLMSLSSSIKTGLDPLTALLNSTELFSEETELGKSLVLFKEQIEMGTSEEEAIRSFASDINHPDINLFRTAFLLARKEGASLSTALRRLAKVTRTRQSFRRKIRAAVAMQKLSSYGIVGSALVIAGIQAASNPQAVKAAISHPIGIKALGAGVSLMAVGLIWMLRLTRSKI
ncbi:MAG: hypothetical protein D6780_04330 [Candidatus Dadabacteria bacterium]|nr:MAG: hypothetical protein D6780_04330 [Candidatus Dadabacteria bacterium]